MGRHPYMAPSPPLITPTPTGRRWIPTSNVTPYTLASIATPTQKLAEGALYYYVVVTLGVGTHRFPVGVVLMWGEEGAMYG